jgi:hypothetical protein
VIGGKCENDGVRALGLLMMGMAGCTTVLGIGNPSAGDDDGGDLDGGSVVDASQGESDGGKADATPQQDLFNAGVFIPTGMNTRAVAIADVDEDGMQDIVAVNRGSNDVSLLRGMGGGGFLAKQDLSAGQLPEDVALADVTGDGHLDIVVAAFGNSKLVLLASLATPGSFAPFTEHSTGIQGKGLAVGNLVGDAKPDAVVCTDQGVRIMEQTAMGVFTAGVMLNGSGMAPQCGVAVARLSGDGLPDIVFTALGLFLATQDGSDPGTYFTPMELLAGPPSYTAVVLTDVDGNDLDDLLLATQSRQLLLLQDPASPGAFIEVQLADGMFESDDVASAQLGGGTLLDAAYVLESADQLVVFVDVSVAPSYAAVSQLPTGDGPRGIAAGDVSGDGKADIVTADNLAGGVTVFVHK